MPYWKTTVVARPCGFTVPEIPAAVGLPADGAADATVGAPVCGGGGCEAMYVKRSCAPVALVPPAVVTVTSTVPEPGGAVVWICVPLSLSTGACEGPKLTVAFERFAPLIVTAVPPAAGPEDGLIDVIVGAGGGPPMLYGL